MTHDHVVKITCHLRSHGLASVAAEEQLAKSHIQSRENEYRCVNQEGASEAHGKVVLSREGGENASCRGDKIRGRSPLLREGVEGILRMSDEEGESRENLARLGERRFSV